jgi:predicted acetyltransferase
MEIRPLRASEMEQAVALDREAFHTPPERSASFAAGDPEAILGAFDAGRLVGIGGAYRMAQVFGGRAVPTGGVHSMAVAPAARGSGVGRAILAALLRAMRERGEAITTLFPATTRFYRAMGYELAGSTAFRRVAPRALERLPRPTAARLRPLAPAEVPSLSECYAHVARETNGFVARPPRWWELARDSFWRGRALFAAHDAGGRITGYLVYRPFEGELTHLGGPFRLALDEILWCDRDAGLALGGLLASWAPQVEAISYRSTAEDPWLLLLPEQELGLVAEVRWMSRLLDPAAAVDARGFAAGLDAEAHLELEDAALPENSGRFVLRVAQGRGRLERGGRGQVRLDANALAALYTGYASPHALARAGRLAAAPGAPLDALAAAFAGPPPWMLEQF